MHPDHYKAELVRLDARERTFKRRLAEVTKKCCSLQDERIANFLARIKEVRKAKKRIQVLTFLNKMPN